MNGKNEMNFNDTAPRFTGLFMKEVYQETRISGVVFSQSEMSAGIRRKGKIVLFQNDVVVSESVISVDGSFSITEKIRDGLYVIAYVDGDTVFEKEIQVKGFNHDNLNLVIDFEKEVMTISPELKKGFNVLQI